MLETSVYGGKESSIVRALEEDIIFGRLEPGTRLIEDVLLARFAVSRHMIRQALYQLEKLGLVRRERNRGAMVPLLSPGEVGQIYEVRELLQRQAALMIPLPAPASLLDRLEKIHDEYSRHVEAGYLRGVHESNDSFHLTLFSACGNDYLVSSIEHYMRLTLPVRAKSLANKELLEVSRQHHRMMIDMMAKRDNWLLAQLCVDHLQPSKLDYLARIAPAQR